MSEVKQPIVQRWELHSFGDNRASARSGAASAKLNVEEAAKLRDEARAKGYAEGLAEGRAAGLQQGRAEGLKEMDNLRSIAARIADEVTHADENIAKDVLDLALDLAQAMVRSALAVRPELIVPIVGEAIRYLPSVQQPALLYLHPQDAAIIRSQMEDELTKTGWRVVEDAQVQRGGCRIDTAKNQIDATINTRWQRLVEALGRSGEWMDGIGYALLAGEWTAR